MTLVKDFPTDQLETKDDAPLLLILESRKEFERTVFAAIKLFFSVCEIDLYCSPIIFPSFTIIAD